MRAVRRLVIIVAVRAEHDDVEPVRSPNGNRVVYNRTTDYFPILGHAAPFQALWSTVA